METVAVSCGPNCLALLLELAEVDKLDDLIVIKTYKPPEFGLVYSYTDMNYSRVHWFITLVKETIIGRYFQGD